MSWSTTDLIARVVRGETIEWPHASPPGAARAFVRDARRHGVHLLAAYRLREAGALRRWPREAADRLVRDLVASALLERVRREELCVVLGRLASEGIPTLLLKGVPLAYLSYPAPWLRPTIDTDVLVREGDRTRAAGVLEQAGYRRSDLVDGSLIMRQAEYRRVGRGGIDHAIDLHWRVTNPSVFASVLRFDELDAPAVRIPALAPTARALDPLHHLAVTCVHRVAHHATAPRLVWRYDVHLLLESLGPRGLDAFVQLARSRRIADVCAAEVEAATAIFPPRPEISGGDLVGRLRPTRREPSAAYLRPAPRKAWRLATDLRWQPGWVGKARLLGQHLFPSRTYMTRAYRRSRLRWLPAMYAHRILTGVGRWLSRTSP